MTSVVVPTVLPPRKRLCWQQAPNMTRCDRQHGHRGPHSWEADAEIATWRRVAYEKIRTRRAIVERVAAGETVEAVAADYDVPVEWVAAISAPGYDFSSDPEAEVEALNDLCQDLADRCKRDRERWRALREWLEPCDEDGEASVRTALRFACEHMDELAGVSTPHQPAAEPPKEKV
jgi:hypothetical protein